MKPFLKYVGRGLWVPAEEAERDNTVWLTQEAMVELFQSSKSNIREHIKHIFEKGELQEDSVIRHFRTTAADGKNKYTT